MASGGHEYSLVGFAEELDRRPLVFLEPLPAAKVCSACGLVPYAKVSLPCDHNFCKPCYAQCERNGQVVCPLDGDTCSDKEVIWMSHPARSILGKQVRCWNQHNGCNVITAAADIYGHFHHQCEHHAARCPKCSAKILASDVCAHLKSRCDASRKPSAAAKRARTVASPEGETASTCSKASKYCEERATAKSMSTSLIEGRLKEISRAFEIAIASTLNDDADKKERMAKQKLLQDSLCKILIEMSEEKDQLDEIPRNVSDIQPTFQNSSVETNEPVKHGLTETELRRIIQGELAAQFLAFTEAMEGWQRKTKAEFDRLLVAINRQYGLTSEPFRSTNDRKDTAKQKPADGAGALTKGLKKAASKIAWAKTSSAEGRQTALALLPSSAPVGPTRTWTFKEYRSLRERAYKGMFAEKMGEPVYLRGYCVSVGVSFWSEREACFVFELHEGKVDRYLEWPFNLQVKWSILHPRGEKKLEYSVMPSRIEGYKDDFSRPIEASHRCTIACSMSFTPSELESKGFIEDGRLLVRLSLEDPPADGEL